MNTGRPTVAGSGSCCHGNKPKAESSSEGRDSPFLVCFDVISSTAERAQLQSGYTDARHERAFTVGTFKGLKKKGEIQGLFFCKFPFDQSDSGSKQQR